MSTNTETGLDLQTSDIDILSNNLLISLSLAEDLLSDLASDKNQFYSIFSTAFGDSFDEQEAEVIRQNWLAGDFSEVAPIEIRSSEELNGANGAFSAQTNRIYLSADFLAQASQEDITSVLIEEIGHWIDAEINPTDSPGDEGVIFSTVVDFMVEIGLIPLSSKKEVVVT